VLDGKHDDLPESAFFLKGSIDDVVSAAKGDGKDDDDQKESEEEQREENAEDAS
jgi:F-type H+/Na+-transporting ATPase subunit beta